MRRIAIWILFVATVLLLAPPGARGGTEVTVYGDNSYPPYSYEENGEAKGIYVEILKVAFSRLEGYTVTIKPTPWKRGLKELEDGTAFALFPPYYHPEKRPFIKPYSKPILTESVVCFCNKSAMANPRPKWPEDYFGLTIGKNAGFEIGGDAFNNAAKEGKIKVVEGKSNESNLLMMAKGRADCYVNDRLSILTELSRLEKSGAITADERVNYVEAVLINEEKGFLGFTDRDQGKFTFKDDFVKKLDQILDEMQKNGEIDKIVQNAIK